MADTVFPAATDDTFDAVVPSDADTTVVIDFWSSTCQPCKQVARILTALAPQLPETVRIVTVSTDDNPVLVDRYDVRSVPTLLILRGHDVVTRFTGVERPQVIRKAVLAA